MRDDAGQCEGVLAARGASAQTRGCGPLSLRAPGSDAGASLVLQASHGAAKAYEDEVREAGTPAFSMTLTGGPEEFEQIRARGVRVLMEPTRPEYGGTDALVDDTAGNIICLHQD